MVEYTPGPAEATVQKDGEKWASIDRRFISMGAAGWHISLDVLDRVLGGTPIDRIAGRDAMQFEGWQRLNADYTQRFGIETPKR